MKKHFFKTLLLSACLLFLNGCITLTSDQAPPTTYVIHPGVAEKSFPVPANHQVLSIPEPRLPAGFETDQIALYMAGGRRLDYYAGARWPSGLDEMLQDVIIRSARHAWPGLIVDAPELNVPANYTLSVDIIDFQPVYADAPSGVPSLHVALRFVLIALPGEIVISDFTLAESIPASSNDLTAITGGLENLLQNILSQAFANMAPRFQSLPPASPVYNDENGLTEGNL